MSNGLNLSFPYLSLSLCLLSLGLSLFLCISIPISLSFLFSSCQTEGAVVGGWQNGLHCDGFIAAKTAPDCAWAEVSSRPSPLPLGNQMEFAGEEAH